MNYKSLFNYLIIDSNIIKNNYMNELLNNIIDEIEEYGHKVQTVHNIKDAQLTLIKNTAIGCILLNRENLIDDVDGDFFQFLKKKGLNIPIFLLTETENTPDISMQELHHVRGYIHPEEETANYIARYTSRAFNEYVLELKTPFFGNMIDWAESGNDMWLCPGHNGGNFLKKSPQGKILHDYLGENFWRADFNFVPDLGDILTHTGQYLKSEQEAAEIFGADRAYYVLNGSSTSVKIVNGALLKEGDLVLCDRNNHKSHHHSLMLYGAIPIFLEDDRNDYGMVGPLNYYALDENKIRDSIRRNELVKDDMAWQKPKPFRAIIIENNTYDGTIYNVNTIVEKVGHLADYIFFDEAWGAFMKFHPLYKGRFGMDLDLSASDPGIYVTQSTHKQLSGMSQASQILVKDKHIAGQPQHINHQRMNEVYMMHMSTSPFFPMFASLDVGAQMMKGEQGFALWDEALEFSIELRKKIRQLGSFYANNDDPNKRWFYDPFVPKKVTIVDSKVTQDLIDVPWEDVPTSVLLQEQQAWLMKEGDSWHGYSTVKDDFVMIDPAKLMLLTPGIDTNSNTYLDNGVPAPMLGKYLRSRGVVHEKTDFNLILFLITPGIEKNKAGTLLAELVRFKELFDDNVMMSELYPELVQEFPDIYEGKRVQDIAALIHNIYKENNAKHLQQQIFKAEHFPKMVMSPRDAHNKMLAGEVDYIPLTEANGRIAATVSLVYPPGVGIVWPGERYDANSQPMMNYFKLFEETNPYFPGFDNEIQGAYLEETGDTSRYYTYVIKE